MTVHRHSYHKGWREDLIEILDNGIANSDDLPHDEFVKRWPLVEHLITNGSIDCRTGLGGYIFNGVTIRGHQYRDHLQKELDQECNINNIQTNQGFNNWHTRPIGIIGLTISAGVLVVFVVYLIRYHLDIPL